MALDVREVLLFQLPVAEEAIVVEAGIQCRANRQVATERPFHGLTEDVSAGVPEDVLPLGVLELQQLEAAAPLQRPRQVPQDGRLLVRRRFHCGLVVVVGVRCDTLLRGLDGLLVEDLGNHHAIRQPLGDALRDVQRRGLEGLAVLHRAVFQLHLDGALRLLGQLLLVLLVQLVPDLQPVLDVRRVLLDLELALKLPGLPDPGASACICAPASRRHAPPQLCYKIRSPKSLYKP
mmetsp:Transcript_109283/g.304642  ORF Transcript_109283/g.304642 Transcript_109283/m.304642 type:complete len:234 (-) Transcript_109283:8-709(-)